MSTFFRGNRSTLLQEFETSISKIPIVRPRFQIPNSYSQNNFKFYVVCFTNEAEGYRIGADQCHAQTTMCCIPAAGIAICLKLSISSRTGSMGCPIALPSVHHGKNHSLDCYPPAELVRMPIKVSTLAFCSFVCPPHLKYRCTVHEREGENRKREWVCPLSWGIHYNLAGEGYIESTCCCVQARFLGMETKKLFPL
jgi:hypothetical protein